MFDEINKIPRRQIIEIFGCFLQININIIHTLMHLNNGLYNRILSLFLIGLFRKRLLGGIHLFGEFLCDLPQGLVWPVAEPVYDTPVVERGGGGTSVREIRAGRVHGENHV